MLDKIIYSKTLVKVTSNHHEEEDYRVYLTLTKESNGYMISVEQFNLGKVCVVYDFYKNKNKMIEQTVNMDYNRVTKLVSDLKVIIENLILNNYKVEM